MTFEFESLASLPRLAWCAHLREGDDLVRVRHGISIEQRVDCFFEGAWDGPLVEGRFDEAITFCGSGARLMEESVLFATPSHMLERLYSIRCGPDLYFSNSLGFLFAESGDSLDLNHADYLFDLLTHYRSGIQSFSKTIRTAGGRDVELHDCANLAVTPSLVIKRMEKRQPAPPVNFREYVDFLESTARRVAENAVDPGRSVAFRMVTMLSTGYDSVASSALAAKAGCREAVTFRSSATTARVLAGDSGVEIGGYLGLETTEYDRESYVDRRDLPEREFHIAGRTDVAMIAMEKQIEGTLLVSGRHGENFWSKREADVHPMLREPRAQLMSGTSLVEFRLRVGFIHFPLPYSGGVNGPAIHSITVSPEMKPWSVGGSYDRPIARRIAEEAGVPRQLFGQKKLGGGGATRSDRLTAGTRRAFQKFYEAWVLPHRPDVPKWRSNARKALRHLLRRLLRLLGQSGAANSLRRRFWDRLDHRRDIRELYFLHWAVREMRARYVAAMPSDDGFRVNEDSPP